MLTVSQRKCLDYIEAYQAAHDGRSPLYTEMRAGLGLASNSNVHRVVACLEERGFIRRDKYKARAIHVLNRGRRPVPVVSYPKAEYFVVERVDDKAVLVPLKSANRVA